MRVLFFSSIFPRPYNPNRGIYCYHVCRAMADAGEAVRVVSPVSFLEAAGRKPAADPAALPGLADLKVDYPLYFYTPRVLRGAYGSFMWASVRRRLRRAVAEFRPDCVVSYWTHPDGEVAVRAAREAGVPSAVMVGGSDVLVLTQQAGRRRRRIVSVLEAADAVVAVSNHMRDQLVGFGVPAAKVRVVYRGIDGRLFHPGGRAEARRRLNVPDAGKVLVYVGNLLPVKGVDVLLDALGRLRAGGADFRAYLVGAGASRPALEAQRDALGLGQAVSFVGAVPQRQLPDWYRAADLAVLASHSEGIPNVLREAMACGTKFVATRVGGIHEIASDPANRLVPAADPAALAEAIAASLADPRPLSAAAGTGTWAESAGRLLDIMRPLVAAGPAPGAGPAAATADDRHAA